MLLPKNMSKKKATIVYMTVCAFHGFLYGVLYMPFQAIFYGLNFKGMISWVVAGLPFDITHGISNFVCGILIMPLIKLLKKLEKQF